MRGDKTPQHHSCGRMGNIKDRRSDGSRGGSGGLLRVSAELRIWKPDGWTGWTFLKRAARRVETVPRGVVDFEWISMSVAGFDCGDAFSIADGVSLAMEPSERWRRS